MSASQHYATPAAFRQALEERLRTRAAGVGTELARLRQLLVFDRFLARIHRAFGDAVVLKGGIVLELRLGRARTTKDIDLRLMGSPGETLARMQAAGRLELGDFLSFRVEADRRQPKIERADMPYEGYRYRVEARLGGKIYGSPFGLDVAFGEPILGEPEHLLGSDVLDFVGIDPPAFRAYPVETHIAEKLHAYTLPRPTPNSRVKDLPDLGLLGRVRPMEEAQLWRAITLTFEHRRTHEVPRSLPPPAPAWADVYTRMARDNRLPWSTLEELTLAVRGFLDPLLERSGATTWDPDAWCWR